MHGQVSYRLIVLAGAHNDNEVEEGKRRSANRPHVED